jgi:hypothetical protein
VFAGARWEDADGNVLFYTDGPQWWLMGHDREVALGTKSIREAADRAVEYLAAHERKDGSER